MADELQKALEKYQVLGNPAKTVLTKITNGYSIPKTWSDLKHMQPTMNDKVLKDGIDQLLDFKIIEKREVNAKKYYILTEKHQWSLLLIARKQSDKMNLDSYTPNEIINESAINSKTTIYGLKSEVFRAVVKGSRNTDISKYETREFLSGIKASEIFGKDFGMPQLVKVGKESNLTEKEIIKAEVDYYLNLLKKGAKIENILEVIITHHRNQLIQFSKAGENIVQKLLEMKKRYRYNELEATYKNLLRLESKGKVKNILRKLKREFISILNHCDISLDWLEETIFKFYGSGRGIFFTLEERSSHKFEIFHKIISLLNEVEKKQIIDFLMKTHNQNLDLYPTHVSFLSRVNSTDFYPELKPKKSKNSKPNTKALLKAFS